MARAQDKLVRVESVTSTGVPVYFADSNLLRIDILPRCRTSSALSIKLDDVYEDDLELGECALEEPEELYPMFDGWPKFRDIFDTTTWDVTTATSPAVKKAVSHLHLVQKSVDVSVKEYYSRVPSSVKSRAHSITAISCFHKSDLVSMRSDSLPRLGEVKAKRIFSRAPSRAPAVPPKLMIDGTACLDKKDLTRRMSEGAEEEDQVTEMPYLGADVVIQEVMVLLAHLENDRRSCSRSLKKERSRINVLQEQIDKHAKDRMGYFARAVQKEHEACSMDINALNWKVSYSTRIENRIKNKVHVAELLNSRIKEDIEFITNHCPLVDEKLILEHDSMTRIKQAQHDTNDELSVTVDRCAKVETKSEEAYNKADEERMQLQAEVELVRKELNKINAELTEQKLLYSSYLKECEDFEQQVAANAQELLVLEVKNENIQAAEEVQQVKNRELQTRLVEHEFEHRKLDDIKISKQKILNEQRKRRSLEQTSRTTNYKELEDKLHNLTLTNNELEMDVEDEVECLKRCNSQQIADEKNMSRLKRELIRCKEQLQLIDEETNKAKAVYHAMRAKLDHEQDHCSTEEDSLKNICEKLRQEIKDEIHTRIALAARITVDSAELKKLKVKEDERKDKLSKKVQKVEERVSDIKNKVGQLRDTDVACKKTLVELKDERAATKVNQDILEKRHKQATDVLDSDLVKTKAKLESKSEHLASMDWKTKTMTKNMEDTMASFKMMTRSMKNIEVDIEKLQDEYDARRIELTGAKFLDQQNVKGLKKMKNRLKATERQHEQLLSKRQEEHDKYETELVDNLTSNKELASRYRYLQNAYLRVKNDLLNCYEHQIVVETKVKDIKEFQSLQKRMHSALLEYYKLRGLYNSTELGRMEWESSQNGTKVGMFKTKIDNALVTISHFLQTQPMSTTNIFNPSNLFTPAISELPEQEPETTRNAPPSASVATTMSSLATMTSPPVVEVQ